MSNKLFRSSGWKKQTGSSDLNSTCPGEHFEELYFCEPNNFIQKLYLQDLGANTHGRRKIRQPMIFSSLLISYESFCISSIFIWSEIMPAF